jgi:hypothetical protein
LKFQWLMVAVNNMWDRYTSSSLKLTNNCSW